MSQRSEKLRRRVDTLEARMDAVELGKVWDAVEASVHNQAALAATTERNAERRRARQAERTAALWRRVAYIALVAAIIVEIIAVLVIHANAACTAPVDPPVGVTSTETAVENIVESEEAENELIESALLAQASTIEDVTVTFYCNEKYPHICGTGDGIAYDGTPALAWATCAVDPDVIPLGSTVMVDLGDGDGLRTLVANDTGDAVNGKHIDLCVATHEEALQLGRRTATVFWVAAE